MLKRRKFHLVLSSAVVILLAIGIACAPAATPTPTATATPKPVATATPVPTATATPRPVATPTPTPVVVATPTATPRPVVATPTPTAVVVATPTATPVPVKPSGTLSVGYGLMAPLRFAPWFLGGTEVIQWPGLGIFEQPYIQNKDGTNGPRLVTEYKISPDGLVWEFKLQPGVQFHKGWGEFTGDDFLWNFQATWRSGSISAASSTNKAVFAAPNGWQKIIDKYTVQIHTGEARADVVNRFVAPFGDVMPFFSKKYFDTVEENEAIKTAIGTGPFEYVQGSAGEFMRLKAVEGHWRQTPAFAELVVWQIADEATRLANFQTGLTNYNPALLIHIHRYGIPEMLEWLHISD